MVQEVISRMDYYNCYEGWFITTAPYFTQAAKNLVKARNVKLYNKNDLALLVCELQKDNDVNISTLEPEFDINLEYIKEDVIMSESYNNTEIKKPVILRYEDKNILLLASVVSLLHTK